MSQVHTQLLTDDASGLLVERTYRLRIVSGPDQGKEHVLDEGTTMVGTHADNDVVRTRISRFAIWTPRTAPSTAARASARSC